MRASHFIFAFLLLVQTGVAAACHSVGDVHVICHSDGIETVYVETKTQTESQRGEKDCCPTFSARPDDGENINAMPRSTAPAAAAAYRHPNASNLVFLPPSRGPPASSAL